MSLLRNFIGYKGINLDTFVRVSNQKYLPEVDALRFLAIIPVMLMHFGTAFLNENGLFVREVIDRSSGLRQVMLNWDLGVKLFFGISGFILTYPFFRKRVRDINFKRYFVRRLVRIEPPYIIALTLFLALHIIIMEKELLFLLERYGLSLLYIHNFVFNEWSYILPVAWSLEIEIQFYILMPVLLLLLKFRDSFYWRSGVYVLLFLTSFFLDIVSSRDVNDYMIYFLPGIIAADIQSQGVMKSRQIGWSLAFFIALFGFFFIHLEPIKPLFLFVLIFSIFRVSGFTKTFTHNKIIIVIGGMCYTLYLLHYPLYILICKVFSERLTFFSSFEANYILQVAITIPVSIFLMSIFFLTVEKPFMILSQRIAKR